MTLDFCRKDFEALIQRIRLFDLSDISTKYVFTLVHMWCVYYV